MAGRGPGKPGGQYTARVIFDNAIAAIGNTPLVRLSRIHPPGNLVAKVEYMNPGGSIKERIAVSLIDRAEELGLLQPGGTIVEPTSGNTGVGLAIVGAVRGYRVICTVPDTTGWHAGWLLRYPGPICRISTRTRPTPQLTTRRPDRRSGNRPTGKSVSSSPESVRVGPSAAPGAS